MKCFVVIFDGEGYEPANKKVFLNYDDAKACLQELVDFHDAVCKEDGSVRYSHRFFVVEFELVGESQ
jgi:hypothetical protein